MSLEDEIAVWSDLGMIDYKEAFVLQTELAEKRKTEEIPDTILFAEHNPVIDFGKGDKHNNFSSFLIEKFGNDEGKIISHLRELGIKFSRTERGSGATYVGPGQLLVYPIVNHQRITGKALDVSEYKSIIDKIMFETLRKIGVDDVKIVEVEKEVEGSGEELRKDRRDIWVRRNNQNYKLGGKGFRFTGDIAYHGFNFYLTNEGIKGFDYIEACGYPKKELDVMSIEKATGRKVSVDELRGEVLKNIKKHFEYSEINKIDILQRCNT